MSCRNQEKSYSLQWILRNPSWKYLPVSAITARITAASDIHLNIRIQYFWLLFIIFAVMIGKEKGMIRYRIFPKGSSETAKQYHHLVLYEIGLNLGKIVRLPAAYKIIAAKPIIIPQN